MKTEAPQPAASGQTFTTSKEVEAHMKVRMDKAVADLQHEMTSIRTGRANISLLDNIRVDYYGTPTPLNQVGNLHVPEPSMITIQPWDISQISVIEEDDSRVRSGAESVERRQGYPAADSTPHRGAPQRTGEETARRRPHHLPRPRCATSAVIANDAVKKLLKDKKIAEDDEKRAHDEIQKLTDAYMAKIDQASKTKEKEILEIK